MLMTPQVICLGFVESVDGMTANLENVKSIVERLEPTNIHEVKIFHGLTTFYRRFIQGFSTMIVPIIIVLEKENSTGQIPHQRLLRR